jgi:hypothetical protein
MKAFVRISAHDKTLTAVEFVNERGKVVLLVESRRTGDPEAPYTAEENQDALQRAHLLATDFVEYAGR